MKRPDLSLCSRCGRCLAVCPLYSETRLETHSPRGRIFLLEKGVRKHPSLRSCLRCGRCTMVCPNGIRLAEYLALESRLSPPFPVKTAVSFLRGRDPSGSRKIPAPRSGSPTLFLSCGALYFYPEGTQKFIRRLQKSGLDPGVSPPLCCGLPFLTLGWPSLFRKKALETLKALSDTRGPILVLCASCLWTLTDLYPLFFAGEPEEETVHEIVSRVRDALEWTFRHFPEAFPEGLVFHFSCHLRKTPRDIPFPALSACCGAHQPFLPRIFHEELLRSAPYLLATACTACYLKLKHSLSSPPEVRHWAEYLSV